MNFVVHKKNIIPGLAGRWNCWIVVLCLAASVASTGQSRAERESGAAQEQQTLSIGPGDLLDITVFDVPELSIRVRVDSSGDVNLPLIGQTHLSGLTVNEADARIAQRLVDGNLVKTPQVAILVEEFATQGTTVTGEVNQAGIYTLMGPHNLYDAISAAGGLTQKAGRTVTVFHRQTKNPEVVTLEKGTLGAQANVPIYPGDTIVVSKLGVVYVVGEVNKPGAVLMENNTNMSLVKAIALAQGTSKVASVKHVYLISTLEGAMTQTEIPLEKIYHGKVADPHLRSEDIVFVPTSNWKVYGPMGIQGAIQAAVYTAYAAELH